MLGDQLVSRLLFARQMWLSGFLIRCFFKLTSFDFCVRSGREENDLWHRLPVADIMGRPTSHVFFPKHDVRSQ